MRGIGYTKFITKTSDGILNKVTLKKELCVPELEANLISVSKKPKNMSK